jgi:hypothetical protein
MALAVRNPLPKAGKCEAGQKAEGKKQKAKKIPFVLIKQTGFQKSNSAI